MTWVKVAEGVVWNFVDILFRRGLSSIVTLLLAYILTPKDFGLIAIVTVFTTVGSTLMESGLKDALVRKADPTQDDYNVVFYATLGFGLFACILLMSMASNIGGFFDEERLPLLVQVAALGIVLSALQVVPSAILHRNLEFKALFKVGVPASFISSLIAIALALLGAGVWSLVAHILLSAGLTAIFLWRLRLWIPSINFCQNAFKKLSRFGYPLFLSALLQIIFTNVYIVIFAKLFSTSVAGLYFFSEKIRDMLITQLVSSIQTVTYPALSILQDDALRLKSGYRSIISVTTFIVFPVMLFLAAITEPLFRTFLPERWWPAASYFQLLCLAGAIYPLHAINLNILKVKGRSDLFLYLEIVKIIITVAILSLSIRFGITGIMVGQIICSVVAYIPNSYYSKKLVGYSVAEQLRDFFPALVLSCLIALCIYLAVLGLDWPDSLKLIVFGFSAPALYLAGGAALKLNGYAYAVRVVRTLRGS